MSAGGSTQIIGRGWARTSRELRSPDLAHVARLVVQILDADPTETAHGQSEGDHLVWTLAMDVDFDRSAIAGHQHGLPERLEPAPD